MATPTGRGAPVPSRFLLRDLLLEEEGTQNNLLPGDVVFRTSSVVGIERTLVFPASPVPEPCQVCDTPGCGPKERAKCETYLSYYGRKFEMLLTLDPEA